MMTFADYLAERLKYLGVKYVFGLPGGPSIPYIEAYRRASIEFILVSGEASAGIMASVSARLTGIPGVCHATFGPGATNLSTGVGAALLDRTPVIALTDEIGDKMASRTVQMNINHQKLFAPLTKATFRLDLQGAPDMIEKAFEICLSEYPGPIHLGLPADIASGNVGASAGRHKAKAPGAFPGNRPAVLSLIAGSRKPLVAIGLTSARLMPQRDLLDWLERKEVPVVVTPMAKGILPEDHPCYAGVLFHSLSGQLKELTGKSDLVIGLGYDPVEYNYESWLPDVPLIHLNTVETDLPGTGTTVQYTGSPAEWLALMDGLTPGNDWRGRQLVEPVRQGMASAFARFTGRFGPVSALTILQEELPSDVIVTADVGSHLHLLGQLWKTNGRKNLLMTNGWSGMGFGIPAALAAKLVRPAAPVVCITGDGGFLMTAGEIMTARRYRLPVIFIVFSDGELNLIRLKKARQKLSPYGTGLYSGELFGSGTFLGIPVLDAGSGEQLKSAVRTALSGGGPVIINAKIDPDDYDALISGIS